MGTRIRAGLLLVVVFLLGAVTGRVVIPSGALLRRPAPAPTGAALYDPLGITAGQRIRIDSILDSVRPVSDALTATVQQRLRSHLDSVDDLIRDVLTPEQLRRLDSMRAVTGEPLAPAVRRRRPAGSR